MYVRKFEADTLEEALRSIKQELGPEAIILKTITNKGLKGAFKKKKIEITAAISEKSYTKKAKVDHVLDTGQKEQFYNNNSSFIANMIDGYSDNRDRGESENPQSSNYGKMGLNRQVKSSKNNSPERAKPVAKKSALDDFITSNDDVRETKPAVEVRPEPAQRIQETRPERPRERVIETRVDTEAKAKIEELESRIMELGNLVSKTSSNESFGLAETRALLRSLEISETFINDVVRKAVFELDERDLNDPDTIYEFALREMLGRINISMPQYSQIVDEEQSAITIFLSETPVGQSSLIYKLSSVGKAPYIIRYDLDKRDYEKDFTEKFFELEIHQANTVAEVVSLCRKAQEEGRDVFVDYRVNSQENDESKNFVDGLRRSFEKVEVLITLSAIHSEVYNTKVMKKYSKIANGINVNYLDLCLGYGQLFNIAHASNLPYVFYGTGQIIPEDVEAATAERILAGMFNLS